MEVRKQEKDLKQPTRSEQTSRPKGQIRPEIMRIVQGVMRDFKKDLDYLKDK